MGCSDSIRLTVILYRERKSLKPIVATYFAVTLIVFFFMTAYSQDKPKAMTAEESMRQAKINARKELAEYEGFLKSNPEQEDGIRQHIVELMIYIDAPTKEILEKVGQGFKNPRKGLYFKIATFLARRKRLDTATEFIKKEEAVHYERVPNDAYIAPCLFCLEAEIAYQKKQYKQVIYLLSPVEEYVGRRDLTTANYMLQRAPYPEMLGLSYFRTGQIDKAVDLYIRVVSETEEASTRDKQLLNTFYLKKHGNLKGLNKEIVSRNEKWKFENFTKPFLKNEAMPDWKLPSYQGQDVSFSDYAGKTRVILFTYSYVTPRDNSDLNMLRELSARYKDIAFIVVDEGYPHPVERRRELVSVAFAGMKPDFPILFGVQSEVSRSFGAYTGQIAIVDKKGTIRAIVSIWKIQLTTTLEHILRT